MNVGIQMTNTTLLGPKGHPRKSDNVIDEIDRLKTEMNVRENTQRVLCNRCEDYIEKHGLPSGLLEHVQDCPFITVYGHDGVDLTEYKDAHLHLQKHVQSELHQAVRDAEAVKHLESRSISAGVVAAFGDTRFSQLQTLMSAALRGVQEHHSQQALENEIYFLHMNGVDVGNRAHSRHTLGKPFFQFVAAAADAELREYLSTINPFTGQLPPIGIALDKYTDKTTGQKFIICTIVIIVNGERKIILGDLIKIAAEKTDCIPAGGGRGLYMHLFGLAEEAQVVGPKTETNTRPRRGMGHRFDVTCNGDISVQELCGGKTQAGMYLANVR